MILIIGATGYIGRHLATRLVSEGERPRCFVRDISRATQILPEDKVELVQGDITRPVSLKAAVQGIDTIIHAGFLTADHKEVPGNRYETTNVGGTANVIEAAKNAKVKCIIEISGLGTKPDKTGSYMQGRYLAERMLIDSGLQWTIIQPSVLFGENAPFIKGLTRLIQTAPILPLIGGGTVRFQPIYVEDVVTVILKVLADSARTMNKIYVIGGPEQYSFSQVLDLLMNVMGKKRLKVYAPTPLVGIGAALMELVLPKPPLTRAALTLFSFDNTTDLNSVERDFSFTPVSFTKYLEEHGV